MAGPPFRQAVFRPWYTPQMRVGKTTHFWLPKLSEMSTKSEKKPNFTIIFYHHKIKPISFTCRKEMCAFILFPFLLIGQKVSQHLRRRNGEVCTFLLNPGKQTSRYFLLAQSGPSFSIFGHTQVRPGYFLSLCRCYKGMACFPVLPALQRWQVRSVLLNFISVFD